MRGGVCVLGFKSSRSVINSYYLYFNNSCNPEVYYWGSFESLHTYIQYMPNTSQTFITPVFMCVVNRSGWRV